MDSASLSQNVIDTGNPSPGLPVQLQTQSPPSVPLRPAVRVSHSNYEFIGQQKDFKVVFHHPGYAPRQDVLFVLSAWDNGPLQPGIHFGLAHNACAIIADNRHDGHLSTSSSDAPDGHVQLSLDEILPAGDYWFFVPAPGSSSLYNPCPPFIPSLVTELTQTGGTDLTAPYCWPVVPTFGDWVFPSNLPPVWERLPTPEESITLMGSQSALSQATRLRDRTCRVTNHSTGTEVAHLCPKHEKDWFLGNSMDLWNFNTSLSAEKCCDDTRNTILLRSDLHKAFDDQIFVMFPKAQDGLVVHMLHATPDLGQLYHNTRTGEISHTSNRFVYARFAWALFPLIGGFLSKADRQVILTRNEDSVQVLETWTRVSLSERAAASRGSSSRKRQHQAGISQFDNDDINPEQRSRKRRHHADNDDINPEHTRQRSRQDQPNMRESSHSSPGSGGRISTHQFSTQTRSIEMTSNIDVLSKTWENITDDSGISAGGNSSRCSFAHEPSTSAGRYEREEILLQKMFDEAERTGMDGSRLPPSMYPGWRIVEKIREQALAKQRPPDYSVPS